MQHILATTFSSRCVVWDLRKNDPIMEIVSELKERMKRKVMRQWRNGEIDYDARLDKLVYTETKEELRIEEESDVDSEEM